MCITKRLIFVVLLFAAALLAVGAFGISSLVQTNERSAFIASTTLPGIKDLEGIVEAQTFARLIIMRYSLTDDLPGKEKYKKMAIAAQKNIGELLAAYAGRYEVDENGQQLLSDTQTSLTSYRNETLRFFAVTGTQGAAAGQTLLTAGGDLDKATARPTASLKRLIAFNRAVADAKVLQNGNALVRATWILGVAILIVLMVCGSASFFVVRYVRASLASIQQGLIYISGSLDLTQRIEVRADDEIGQTAAALNTLLQRVATVLASILVSSDSVATASGQISAGNTDLSARTEEQAASLEQTAASMNELTSTVRENAEAASRAHALADGAARTVERAI